MARTLRRTKPSRYRRKRSLRYRRKMLAKPRIGKRLYQPIHYFTRSVSFSLVLGAGNNAFHGSSYFAINTLPSWNEFQNLYDMYKINAIKISFIPVSNVTLWDATNARPDPYTVNFVRFQSVIDYNDSTPLTTADAYREYSTYKWTPFNKTHTRFFRPKITQTVTEGGGTYGVSTGAGGWVSLASNATRFYGIKYHYNLGVAAASTLTTHEVEVKYYLSFKNYK